MKTVEELDVFKLAHELALEVYKATTGFPKDETFSLVSQMRRAARPSQHSNHEGFCLPGVESDERFERGFFWYEQKKR